MAISNSSTGAEWNGLPLFAEDTPVSLSVKQVTAKVKKILATCGLGYDKPLASYDPIMRFWRMSAGIFPLGEQPLLPVLPPSGMTRNGALFQQPAWEPITDATGSLSWPTPKANLHNQTNWYLRLDGYRHNAGEIPPGWEHLSGKPMNLAWWEWLMGFPTGWTDLED